MKDRDIRCNRRIEERERQEENERQCNFEGRKWISLLEGSQARLARPSDRKCENENVRKMEVVAQTRAA